MRTAQVVLGFAVVVTRWRMVCYDGKWEAEVVVEIFQTKLFPEKVEAVQTATALKKKLVEEWQNKDSMFCPRPKVRVKKALRYRQRVIAL